MKTKLWKSIDDKKQSGRHIIIEPNEEFFIKFLNKLIAFPSEMICPEKNIFLEIEDLM